MVERGTDRLRGAASLKTGSPDSPLPSLHSRLQLLQFLHRVVLPLVPLFAEDHHVDDELGEEVVHLNDDGLRHAAARGRWYDVVP